MTTLNKIYVLLIIEVFLHLKDNKSQQNATLRGNWFDLFDRLSKIKTYVDCSCHTYVKMNMLKTFQLKIFLNLGIHE